MPNYIPARESELITWVTNLATQLSTSSDDYGMTADQVHGYQIVQQNFMATYNTAQNPLTRSKPYITAKNEAKKILLDATRPLVQTLQNYSGMTDEKRDLLEIPVRDNQPTPVNVPTEMPNVKIEAVNGQVMNLELKRDDGSKRKPVGVRSAWLYTFVGDTPPSDLKDWRFEGGTTRNDPQIIFPQSVTPGTVVWVTALWINPTEQAGPACAPVKSHINYVGLNQAA